MNEEAIALDAYIEELKYMGVPVDDIENNTLLMWFRRYRDNLEMDSIGESVEGVLVRQHSHDIGTLVGQMQLMTQRMQRIEDEMKLHGKRVVREMKDGR